MDIKNLQHILNQSYNRENWKQIVQFVFPNVSLFERPMEFPIDNDKIKRFAQLGNVRLNDGKNLALFELTLADDVNLQRNRVELNNEVSKYIDQEQIHGVLSVFEQGREDYRFTFSARSTEFDEEESDFVTKKTDTKRFTYVLGQNESCKTAAKRFFELSENKDSADIEAIQKAFSVEKLSKEFFDKYKSQFEKFWGYINTNDEYRKLFLDNDKEKQIRDFTKKLLGRIVFLHFLQKKGWMGCDAQVAGWENGEKQFMQKLFADFAEKNAFHSKCLHQLFFNTLNNNKRENFIFQCDGVSAELNGTKIPYLNGGLFDADKEISAQIDFPQAYFTELFDLFSQYNFTIDENDPNDHEVGIDPEMLGHIFENLLEDNKDKGAFYTPKIIVQYMCQESLIEYLATKLNAEPDTVLKSAIEDLVRNRLAQGINDLDKVDAIAQALHVVKICDPAIGSGAFPMGILNEIFKIIEDLYFLQPDAVSEVWNIDSQNWQPHLVKKSIIQNSIYGVDLESGAVDIARLRFWLALIVDETEPLPLPNLDYKIMQGNSLLESYEGIDLSQIADAKAYEEFTADAQIDIFTGEAKKKVKTSVKVEDIQQLMQEYFSTSEPETKKEIHEKIEEQVFNHIKYQINKHKRSLKKNIEVLEAKVQKDANAAKTDEQKNKILTNSKAAKDLIKNKTALSEYIDKDVELNRIIKSNDKPFFLWNLYFKDVFDQGGFDIVIGNPPYIGERGNELIFQNVANSSLGRKFYTRWMDFFYFFFHLGIDILKQNGNLVYITTNYFFTSTGGKLLREDLFNRTQLVNILNFNEIKIFESAIGQHNVITQLIKSNSKERKMKVYNFNERGFINTHMFRRKINLANNVLLINQNNIYEDSDYQIRLNGTGNDDVLPNTINILNKLSINSKKLIEITDITMGIVSLSDTVSNIHINKYGEEYKKGDGIYVLNESEVNNLDLSESEKYKFIKPFFKNSDIERYSTNKLNSKWLIYIKDEGQKICLPDGLKKHFEKYKPIIVGLKDNFLKNEIAGSVVKKWYANGNYFVLFTPKKEHYFTGEKIIAPYRNKQNIFSYDTKSFFGSKDIAYILPKDKFYSLKFLTIILNSNLIYLWLYEKGKRKGEMLELYKKPLSDIPIKITDSKTQHFYEQLFDYLQTLEKNTVEYNLLLIKIDIYVYKLYGLTYDDILYIRNEISNYITENDYNNLCTKNWIN